MTQIGCNGLAACPTTGLKHTFSYFDDIATAGSGFDTAARWETGTNPTLPVARLVTSPKKLSGLGASVTNAGDGRIYVGFNPASPSKTGSVGGSFAMNGATNQSVIECMDLNGDSLPDKVYRQGVKLHRRQRCHQIPAQHEHPVGVAHRRPDVGATHTLSGFSEMPVQRSIGIQGGIEAYFGVYGVFNVGGQWSWVDSYFTDANGDGLPDLVRGTEVLFNHLVCGTGSGVENCLPTVQRVRRADPGPALAADRARQRSRLRGHGRPPP